MKQRCESCRFYWDTYRGGGGEIQGHCRLTPPVFIQKGDFPQATFVFTEPNWWCGQWTAKGTEAPF